MLAAPCCCPLLLPPAVDIVHLPSVLLACPFSPWPLPALLWSVLLP